MKKYGKALLLSTAAFGIFAGSASADALTTNATTESTVSEVNTASVISPRATYYNPVIKMKVGWSTFPGMAGSRLVIKDGVGVVELVGDRLWARKPGRATVYNYAADGNLYINPVEVTY